MIEKAIKISSLYIDPPIILAPMAGATHVAFRELVAVYGGCGLFYTEMLNSRRITPSSIKSDPFLFVGKRDRPLVAQIAGVEPEKIAYALQLLQETKEFDAYDLNLGCSKGTIQHYGWGARILEDKSLLKRILIAAREVVNDRPLFAKIRSLPDHNKSRLIEIAKLIEGEGIDAIIFHPRTRKDGFKRPAIWAEISFLKRHIHIPVIGNGDIFSPKLALKMFKETGCDGVMIGRGALMRPWILRDIYLYIKKGETYPPPEPLEVIDLFINLVRRLLPEDTWKRYFRIFSLWFLKNFQFGHYYFKEIMKHSQLNDQIEILKSYLKKEKFSSYPVRPW